MKKDTKMRNMSVNYVPVFLKVKSLLRFMSKLISQNYHVLFVIKFSKVPLYSNCMSMASITKVTEYHAMNALQH